VITSVTATTPGYAVQVDAAAGCLRGGSVQPQYPALDARPLARATRVKGDAAAPAGAGCFEELDSAATWITVASVIRTSDTASTFVGRLGAISQLLTVQYWSTTQQKWRPLVSSAHAIATVGAARPIQRGDYSAAELASAQDRYYVVADSRSGQDVTYRMRLRLSQPGRVVVETANVDAVKQWGITIYAPEGLHTLYFFDERAPGVWAYYSITRVLPKTFLAEGHEKSYINRAVALYRHYVHLPTNGEAPSAP
jgi:hypothetical protein